MITLCEFIYFSMCRNDRKLLVLCTNQPCVVETFDFCLNSDRIFQNLHQQLKSLNISVCGSNVKAKVQVVTQTRFRSRHTCKQRLFLCVRLTAHQRASFSARAEQPEKYIFYNDGVVIELPVTLSCLLLR